MPTALRILLVEDSDEDAALLNRFLKGNNLEFSIKRVWNKDSFVREVEEGQYDLIIADHTMPSFSGMEAFRISRNLKSQLPFILITGSVSEKLLTEYSKEGIDDYILKDNLLRLPASIENVINKKKLEIIHKKLENAHKDIKDSINYAKIIQYAMLPDKKILHEIFPRSFIFFKPKDILSGDFYWFERSSDTFLFAAADCTGHGVPGALLAVMGNNLLNQAVNLNKLTQPSLILDNLNSQVYKILKHQTTALHDGMDIAFCSVDLNNKQLCYAGANRPLLIIRDGELFEFKPDKIPIGGSQKELKYTDQGIQLLNGDRIYLFSDGYADQFHHSTGKKMMIKRLKNLLLTTSGLPINAQKKIVTRFFENWKGRQEQVDDVLLMCVQIT
jgi:serine phosphatase RsbU (regulator of sigma subunit)